MRWFERVTEKNLARWAIALIIALVASVLAKTLSHLL
jgi:antibiotic biosynthesis monooxygenase (ABM) superfamily enzyme